MINFKKNIFILHKKCTKLRRKNSPELQGEYSTFPKIKKIAKIMDPTLISWMSLDWYTRSCLSLKQRKVPAVKHGKTVSNAVIWLIKNINEHMHPEAVERTVKELRVVF